MTTIILIILVSIVLVSFGQVMFKKGVAPLETPNLRSPRSYWNFIVRVAQTPAIWMGFGLIALSIVAWLIALAQTELSLAYPLNSMQYLVILVASRIFLGEKIDRMKILGTILVIVGISLITRS